MRLGAKSPDEFITQINEKSKTMQGLFLERIKTMTELREINVMLGDSTVTDQKTFDPKAVSDYFQKINNHLGDWSVQDVSISNNEDVRRIFTKFEATEGSYLISGHMSIQFHVLLYYRPDQRVIDCQKQLSQIIDQAGDREKQISEIGDQVVLGKLKSMGHDDPGHQDLFELLYRDDGLRDAIYSEMQSNGAGTESADALIKKKTKLFEELDSLLMETYQIVPVLIDDARLVTGEEGCLCTVDLEFVKNRNREGLFDPRRIPDSVRQAIHKRLDDLSMAITSS